MRARVLDPGSRWAASMQRYLIEGVGGFGAGQLGVAMSVLSCINKFGSFYQYGLV